ncbi:MAG: hypothetical protein ACRECX_15140 [Methyloceanibacter sp.]|uniref:hypothetical protein n=1 Tax=Methyloceanibacter sp. TaxID=1965321 RepID=UPI003D6CDBBB
MSSLRNAYRPERHYMRGPGPKWHAKHTASLVAAAGAQRVLGPDERGKPPRPRSMAGWIAPTAAAAVLGFVAVMVLA